MKILGIILVLFLIGILLIYNKGIIPKQNKKTIYLEYKPAVDKSFVEWWKGYEYYFPDDFEIDLVLVDPAQLDKLDEQQKSKYDSLVNVYFQKPRKYISAGSIKKEYGISIARNEVILFEYENVHKIDSKTLKSLGLISFDSILKILIPNENKMINEREQLLMNIRYKINLIEIDSINNEIYLIPVIPNLVLYH